MAQNSTRGALVVRVAMICTLLLVSLVPIRRAAAVILAPAQLYVSASTGVDSWAAGAGTTKESAYKTIQFAIYNAGPGTTIFLSPEVHTITQGIWWAYDRPAGNTTWMYMQPYANQQQMPILECGQIPVPPPTTPPTNPAPCIGIEAQYVEIKGLKIRNAPHSGITVQNGSHVRLLNNEIELSKAQGIYVFGQSATDILIDGNRVHNNAQTKVLPLIGEEQNAPGGGWASGIGIQHQASNVTVSNNEVYHNNGEGIGISAKVGTLVRGNIIHDNFSVNMYINGAHDATVERNFIYTSDTQTTYYRYNAPANGISVSNEHDLDATTLSNLTIRNNIVVGGRYAFYYGGFERIAGGMKNSFIVNNTFYTNKAYTNSGNSATVFIGLDNDANWNPVNNHAGTKFFNNAVMHGATTGAIRTIASAILSTHIEFKHNGWYTLGSPAAGTGTGPNDKTTNPLFVNPGGVLAGTNTPLADYYKLTSASPLISAGINLGAGNDFWGDARPQGAGPEIGADEYAPTVAFAQASYTVMEGSAAVITIRLSQPMSQQVNLSYVTSDGSAIAGELCKGNCPTFGPNDYPASAGFVTFPVGQTEYTFSIPTYSDGVIEQNEYFRVTLSTPPNIALGTPSTTLVYISDGNTEDE